MWAKSKKEYVRRAGFVMIAELAVHDKHAADGKFENFFPLLMKYSTDDRNFVKKAINWALRQIGKRNFELHKKSLTLAFQIQNIPSSTAKWITSDAIRELQSPKTLNIISKRMKFRRSNRLHY